MTPVDVNAEWIAKARRAADEAGQALRNDQSVVLMPAVEVQPVVDLLRWRVMRLTSGRDRYDVLVGYDACTEKGRVSTPVQAFDAARAEASTRSGRIYRLVAAPGYSDDGEYVFRTLFDRVLTVSNHSDVSNEYSALIRAAEPASASGTDADDTSLL